MNKSLNNFLISTYLPLRSFSSQKLNVSKYLLSKKKSLKLSDCLTETSTPDKKLSFNRSSNNSSSKNYQPTVTSHLGKVIGSEFLYNFSALEDKELSTVPTNKLIESLIPKTLLKVSPNIPTTSYLIDEGVAAEIVKLVSDKCLSIVRILWNVH